MMYNKEIYYIIAIDRILALEIGEVLYNLSFFYQNFCNLHILNIIYYCF